MTVRGGGFLLRDGCVDAPRTSQTCPARLIGPKCPKTAACRRQVGIVGPQRVMQE